MRELEIPLPKAKLEPSRYSYLSQEDSDIYDAVKDSTDPKDVTIKRLLEDKAKASWASFCAQAR